MLTVKNRCESFSAGIWPSVSSPIRKNATNENFLNRPAVFVWKEADSYPKRWIAEVNLWKWKKSSAVYLFWVFDFHYAPITLCKFCAHRHNGRFLPKTRRNIHGKQPGLIPLESLSRMENLINSKIWKGLPECRIEIIWLNIEIRKLSKKTQEFNCNQAYICKGHNAKQREQT